MREKKTADSRRTADPIEAHSSPAESAPESSGDWLAEREQLPTAEAAADAAATPSKRRAKLRPGTGLESKRGAY